MGNTTDDEDDDLTDDERQFLRTVVKAPNGELEEYDFTQPMTSIKNTSGSQIDISKLEEKGYLEVHHVRGRKYYYVTPEGQTVIGRTLNRGRNIGDPYEKPGTRCTSSTSSDISSVMGSSSRRISSR